MSLITIQLNPTDKFELEQAKEMIDAALSKIKKEEEEREKMFKVIGLGQGLETALPRVRK